MTEKPMRIDIIQNTQIVKTLFPASKKEAAKIYFAHQSHDFEYTLLTVGKREYTTAQAERFFAEFEKDKTGIQIN